MNEMFLRSLAALIRVKTIVTLTVMAVFAVLSLRGSLAPDIVMGVVTMVVAFYFGTQSERHGQPAPEAKAPQGE